MLPERAVRRLAIARTISWAGSQAAYIALIALVFERSGGSGLWISAALLAAMGARVAASPWAGTLGDYFDRRVVMIGSDLAAACCFIAISAVHDLPLIVLLAALAGLAEAPFSPASGALMRMLVPDERRGWANGLIAAGTSTGMLFGAAFGGVLVATVGVSAAFLCNASSFVASAVLVVSIGGRYRVDERLAAESRGVTEGLRLLFSVPVLRRSAFSVGLVALALGMTNVAEYPLFVHIGAGRVGFGVAVAVWGAGQIVGGRLASRIIGWRFERLTLIGGCAIASVGIGLSGAIPFFVAVAFLFFAAGFGNSLINIGLVMAVQRWSPLQLQGRTQAAVEAVANSAVAVSLVIGGVLLGALGPQGVYLLAGGLGCLAVVMALRIPPAPSELPLVPSSGAERARDDSMRADAKQYEPNATPLFA